MNVKRLGAVRAVRKIIVAEIRLGVDLEIFRRALDTAAHVAVRRGQPDRLRVQIFDFDLAQIGMEVDFVCLYAVRLYVAHVRVRDEFFSLCRRR